MGLLELPPVSTCVIKVGLDERPKQEKLFSCQLKVLLNLCAGNAVMMRI